jgi:hypothetical protein
MYRQIPQPRDKKTWMRGREDCGGEESRYLPKTALEAHSFVYEFLTSLERCTDFFNNEVLDLSKAADVCSKERAVLNVSVQHSFVSRHAQAVRIKRVCV